MTPQRSAELAEMSMALDLVVEDEGVLTPRDAAQEYFNHYRELPEPLRYWHSSCVAESAPMFASAKTSGTLLFGTGDELRFYSLHLEDFALPELQDGSYDIFEPENPLYLWQNIPLWEYWIKKSFKNELFWKIEGNSSRICAHIIAGKNAGLLHLPRYEGSEKIKPIHKPEGLLAYLYKPPLAIKEGIKTAANGYRGYDVEEAITRLSYWISERRFFYNRSRYAALYRNAYRNEFNLTGKELEVQRKKYLKLLDLNPASWQDDIDDEINECKAVQPEWFNKALYQNEGKPFMLPKVKGFYRVKSKTLKDTKVNPSNITTKLQSCYNLREFQKRELALIEAARKRGTNILQSPFMNQSDRFAP